MVFSSMVFLCAFMPLAVLLYHILPKSFKNVFLLAVSLVFYAWGEPRYIFIMLFSAVFDYINGRVIEYAGLNGRAGLKKLFLVLSVAVNVGLLSFFKYSDFIIENFSSVFGVYIAPLRLTLPIGISFYTFQTLSYTIDVYRGNVKAQRSLVDFGMYISMFPQLIAGPIVRYADIEQQLKNRAANADEIASGIFRFSVGLSKKVMLANAAGELWNEIYSFGGKVPVLTAWLGAAAFMLQIYFDFSGYSDMAIGLGHMFGFTFPENFDHPYEAKSVTEFWRRWHITLGVWFREYLYIPLGGNRRGKGRQIFNLFVVWFLTGLWHGAGWNFILWGLYFFVLLALEKFVFEKPLQKTPAALRRALTLTLICFSWVIFACDDAGVLKEYIRSMFTGELCNGMSLYYVKSYAVTLLLGAVLSVSVIPRALSSAREKLGLSEKTVFCVKAVFCVCLTGICLLLVAAGGYNPFLYFRF